MLHGIVPDTILPQASLMFSGPLWSISLEWQFYLIAPFLIGAIGFGNARRIAISAGILLVAIGLEKVAMAYWTGEVPSFLPLRLPLFIVGIMCAALWREARPVALAAAVVSGFVIASLFSPNRLPLLMWFGMYFFAATHDKLGIARLADRIISSRVPSFIGQVSHGLYVLHVPTMMLVNLLHRFSDGHSEPVLCRCGGRHCDAPYHAHTCGSKFQLHRETIGSVGQRISSG